MNTSESKITVSVRIPVDLPTVWRLWNDVHAIRQWYHASEDWHTPRATHDLEQGKSFSYRMEAKDGTEGFDMQGKFISVIPQKFISYVMEDGRLVEISFKEQDNETVIEERLDPENINSEDLQRTGWQRILNNFSTYVLKQQELVPFQFQKFISAEPMAVYDVMIHPTKYTQWTAPFCPGSYFEGSWEKGAHIKFVGPEKDGQAGGMLGHILENTPGKFISIKYDGSFEGDKEKPFISETWKDATENYIFERTDGGTNLKVDLQAPLEYADFFNTSWPQALQRLKVLIEESDEKR